MTQQTCRLDLLTPSKQQHHTLLSTLSVFSTESLRTILVFTCLFCLVLCSFFIQKTPIDNAKRCLAQLTGHFDGLSNVVSVLRAAFKEDSNTNFSLFDESLGNHTAVVDGYVAQLQQLRVDVDALHSAVGEYASVVRRVLLALFESGVWNRESLIEARKNVTSCNNTINISECVGNQILITTQ